MISTQVIIFRWQIMRRSPTGWKIQWCLRCRRNRERGTALLAACAGFLSKAASGVGCFTRSLSLILMINSLHYQSGLFCDANSSRSAAAADVSTGGAVSTLQQKTLSSLGLISKCEICISLTSSCREIK